MVPVVDVRGVVGPSPTTVVGEECLFLGPEDSPPGCPVSVSTLVSMTNCRVRRGTYTGPQWSDLGHVTGGGYVYPFVSESLHLVNGSQCVD